MDHRATRIKVDSKITILEQERVVLLYDPEKTDISLRFTAALEKFITALKFRHFEETTEQERQSLPIVVVVRSTTMRLEEDLDKTSDHLKDILVDCGNVIVIYFQTKRNQISRRIQVASNSGKYEFWKIIEMDFSGFTLYYSLPFFAFVSPLLKPINESAQQNLERAYGSLLNREIRSVPGYYDKTSDASERFLEKVDKSVRPRIHLEEAPDIITNRRLNLAGAVYKKNRYRSKRAFIGLQTKTDTKGNISASHAEPSVTQELIDFCGATGSVCYFKIKDSQT